MAVDVIHNPKNIATLGTLGATIVKVDNFGTLQKIDKNEYPNASGEASRLSDAFHDGSIPSNALLDGYGRASTSGVTTIIPAQGEGQRIYVTYLSVSNPTAFNREIQILDGGTVKSFITAPANAGAISNFEEPLRLSANKNLEFAQGSGVVVSAVGYKLDY